MIEMDTTYSTDEKKDERLVDTKQRFYNFPQKKSIDALILKRIFNYLPLSVIIILSLILRLLAAQESLGFIHPDEVFQSIEMVHFKIFGLYGTGETIPWEFNTDFEYGGARSWFFVYILIGLYRFMMLLGINDPIILIYGIRVFLSLFSIITVIVAYFFGKEAFNKTVGLISSFICGVWWFFPFWASRTMTDSISSDLLFLSIFLIYKGLKTDILKKKITLSAISGFLLGLAFMIRFPSALMVIPLVFVLLFMASNEVYQRKKQGKISLKEFFKPFYPFLAFCCGAFLMVIAQGILDYFTWGSFLQSPINFFMYNIVEGNSAHHGIAPWYHYFSGLFHDFGDYFIILFLLFFVLGIIFNEKIKTKSYMLIICIYWIGLFSLLAHKEFRFIMTLLPVAIILVANGIYQFIILFRKKSYQYTLLSLLLIIFCLGSLYMTAIEKVWMWKFNSGICNAMHWVGQQEDVELVIVFEMVWYTGGYAYLDNNVSVKFTRINFFDPFLHINSTYYKYLYAREGTYIVIRSYEFNFYDSFYFDVAEFFNSQNLVQVANIAGYPNAYVYRSVS
ncbi:MAG: hypothetical protein EAX90_12420 [Candidatus Heimdallarchaeota archaeon]|nr:hypothetical protein [Candidatus Heimdallarchaeota archaeon]